MSHIITLFQAALPVWMVVALVGCTAAGFVLLLRPLGGLRSRRPRIVTTRRPRDLTRRM